MKVLVQRAIDASVVVEGEVIGAIDHGQLVLVGIEKGDTEDDTKRLADKLLKYRMFSDDDGKMNLNVQQVGGGVLLVSQFTLAAETKKGLRPGFSTAAVPEEGRRLFDDFVAKVKTQYDKVETGQFGADMKIRFTNDGPVTFMLD
ncbi:D-aminoacyl-tRNA deacylase [Marinomonas mediterranea]|jgi:D-tyrosyl-tRNA(Tyr) deacylase|uniref:D-aminoacyl-tRNA deacylase n=1 Tax=Marinomonas mediterranea (strain ATCC 700492 / JCM 21426 / NBRC 103028 / MMB-1) TaxID=717774 RepID=F2JTS4_MARM1|nr:D-aminoacyl-tRNA deacylase [Marinomonas mediterranea]ADZ92694.1 D-tyrosyl-tRNA(Tyr) deacylase [Marinomonas mediterranea MMB-1]WCN10629.1 D-tyrosyl-tRNA(Tyr) deacylase [Marinomonas mediterranea]WCN14686.1 D-tyrosyl-tRNA(Tyr) deacylase [Marinomonas mediterranea]WCN18725.1 D-tyrosyl-tRNA(Tyr) deacylase [Marinomonas mediterranea MMB-1]